MNCYGIWVDIIVPIISAFVGGLITMLGVIITIFSRNRKDKKNALVAVKPWIYSLDRAESGTIIVDSYIYIASEENFRDNASFIITIKNTDNGIGIVESFQTKNKIYYPMVGRILEKNKTTNLAIYLDEGTILEEMYLVITDIYDNKYKYKVIQTNNKKQGYRIREIK